MEDNKTTYAFTGTNTSIDVTKEVAKEVEIIKRYVSLDDILKGVNLVDIDEATRGYLDVLVGIGFGDEGKGKLVDELVEKYDICCRAMGTQNAGHTIYKDGVKTVLHGLPSGIMSNIINVIGHGVLLDMVALREEIKACENNGAKDIPDRLILSNRIHVVTSLMRAVDAYNEALLAKEKGGEKIGTTLKGSGPTLAAKANRNGFTLGFLRENFEAFAKKFRKMAQRTIDRCNREAENLLQYTMAQCEEEIAKLRILMEYYRPMIRNTALYLRKAIDSGKKILCEGANAFGICIDHGAYPNTTSANCTVAGNVAGLGLRPKDMRKVFGVCKFYDTKVGTGKPVTYLPYDENDETCCGYHLVELGFEFGSSTGRRRWVGYFDAVFCRYSLLLSGVDVLAMNKLDVLTNIKELKICVAYKFRGEIITEVPEDTQHWAECEPVYEEYQTWTEDITNCKTFEELPLNAQIYVAGCERAIGKSIDYIGINPHNGGYIVKNESAAAILKKKLNNTNQ